MRPPTTPPIQAVCSRYTLSSQAPTIQSGVANSCRAVHDKTSLRFRVPAQTQGASADGHFFRAAGVVFLGVL
jgi:hypothetical protein